MKPESQVKAAERLSAELNQDITRAQVRHWISKGYDLSDPEKLRKQLANQERGSVTSEPETIKTDPTNETTIEDLKARLLEATDYETARVLRTQISGIRDIMRELREQRLFIPIDEMVDGASMAGIAMRAVLEGLEDELPPQLEGLTALQMKAKLRDYGRMKCAELGGHYDIKPEIKSEN